MKNKVRFFSIIVIVLLCILFCRISLSTSNDTFYLIKLGESIFKNGIDMKDHFSWIPNLMYTYPHWLYSLFLFFIYNNFGFFGIYIENVICYIVLILSIYYVNIKINNNNMLALFVSIISIFSLNAFIVPRSQSMSIIFIFLSVYFINQLINTGKKKYSIYLALCSLIIANVHATIWIGFFVFFFPFFGEHIIYLYNCKRKKRKLLFNDRLSIDKVKNIRLLFITFIVCFLMGLFTPTRICYTYFIKTALGNSQSFISEHLPLIIIYYPIVYVLGFFMFFIKSKMKLTEFLMVNGIFLMSLMSKRHLIFLFTIGILYFSIFLKREMQKNNDSTFEILETMLAKKKGLNIIIVILLILCCYFKIDNNLQNSGISEEKYPVLAVDYIKENLDYGNIKIINSYSDGSYLLFNDIKVFIDSRCDLYLKEFNVNDITVFDDYAKYISIDGKYDYNALVEKYGGEYVLLNKNDYIYYILEKDNRYKIVYEDDNYGLYQKILKK